MTIRHISIIALCLCVLGCGGGGDTKHGPSDAFAGSWSGTYARTEALPATGTISVRIGRGRFQGDDGGVVTGTATDSVKGAATVSGIIPDKEGNLSQILVTFSDGFSDIYNGTPRIDSRGHLVGTFTLALVDVGYATDFDLAPVPQ